MSMQEARTILNITDDDPSDKAIKAAYHRLALKHHPDMDGGSDAEFITISNAKNTLLEQTQTESPPFTTAWGGHLKAYLRVDQVVKVLLAQLTSAQIAAVWGLSKREDAGRILGEDITSEFRKQILEISKVVTIRPSIESALAQMIHPLEVQEETFYVPLWHSHVEFECKGRILIVNIDTIVPSHVTIDSDNIIHVNIARSAADLLRLGYLDVAVGDRTFRLPAASIRTVKAQSISLGDVGLPCIHYCDPLNVSILMKIMVHLTLSLE